MTDRGYNVVGTAGEVLVVIAIFVAVGWLILTAPTKPAPTPHHCPQCEIAYSRGLFHGIDYAERGVARLEDQDGHRYIVWTGDIRKEK